MVIILNAYCNTCFQIHEHFLWNSSHTIMTSSNGNIFQVIAPFRGEPPVTSGLSSQRPVTRSFDVFWTNGWANNRDAGDLRRHFSHYNVIVMPECHRTHLICQRWSGWWLGVVGQGVSHWSNVLIIGGHQPRLWFITGGYLVKRWFIPAAARARGQSNDLNREILASNLFNCHKEVINTPPVSSISRCIHIVYRHKNVWEYQWSNFIYNCISTFLHYVHCKNALLDCSAPGGERCESLTWVDENYGEG